MSKPINPKQVTDLRPDYLPAYLSNGLIGLRVREIPLRAGMTIVSGYAGRNPATFVEAAADAPYPLAGDIQINRNWLSDTYHRASFHSQDYDFSCGELHTRFSVDLDGVHAGVEVLTFCSRTQPTLALQEVTLIVNKDCDVVLRASVDATRISGEMVSRHTRTPGEPEPVVDGSLRWASLGNLSSCGAAYVTEFIGGCDAQKSRSEWDPHGPLATAYAFRARAGRAYRLRQMTALVPSSMHHEPDQQALRMTALAKLLGFDALRDENRAVWREIWRGRILLHGAEQRWQALADAAFYYLNASVHSSSPASTSIFGLAQWYNYHYYYGHIMWDNEAFTLPALLLLQPNAARVMLNYRSRMKDGAAKNAQAHGWSGLQFPWESSPVYGEEAAPGQASGAAYEHFVSLNVAHAFVQFANASGDLNFLRQEAWPVLDGVAHWIESRVVKTGRGYEIQRTMGIAEKEPAVNNPAYTNLLARLVLQEAGEVARRIGYHARADWQRIADELVVPEDPATGAIVSHDGWCADEEKGATPGPLAALFPIGCSVAPDVERATLQLYLGLADRYIGSPMLSALYGVWAARLGDRALALRMLEEGYAKFVSERFLDTHEYRADKFPEQPWAGPFFANLGGFLIDCLYGFPGLQLSSDEPAAWCRRPVVLPEGWEAIEVERLWARGRAAHLVARHGADHAELTLSDELQANLPH